MAALSAILACGSREDDAPPVAEVRVTVRQPEASPGSPVDFVYRFAVAADTPSLADDYVVFVHFVDEDGEQLWTDDHLPPTPVRAWKPGAVIEYTRTMFVPKVAHEGETRILVGIYSPKSGERLPLAAQSAGMRSYAVGRFTMRNQPHDFAVTLKEGWYDMEGGDGGPEWHWSRQQGVLSFRNPRRRVELLVELDQPVNPFPDGQRVELRTATTVVDTFALRGRTRELRRVPLSPDQMGTTETVEITVAVDPSFVPASIPQLASTDRRELGIRLFRAYVEPK